MSRRKVEPTSFNLDDPFEKRLHDHAKQFTFSTYVKRLIQRDMEGGQPAWQALSQDPEPTDRKAVELKDQTSQPVPPLPQPIVVVEEEEESGDDVSGFV